MTVDALIAELQKVSDSGRGDYQVEDRESRTIGWVRRGSEKDERNRIVAVLPEVDF